VLLDARVNSTDWVTLHYEDLAREPIVGFETLFAQLGLGWTDEIRRFVSDTTSTHEEGYYATSRVSSKQIGRWKSALTPQQSSRP
jgi:hypothetical protein